MAATAEENLRKYKAGWKGDYSRVPVLEPVRPFVNGLPASNREMRAEGTVPTIPVLDPWIYRTGRGK